MKVLVIGGTGTVGSQVVEKLALLNVDVRVLTHDPNKVGALPKGAQGIVGSFDAPETLPPAFEGVHSVFFLVPVNPRETEQGITVVNEAVEAEVHRIVYMSVAMPRGSEHIPNFRSKIPIEQAVASSGMEYTILRPTNFYQNDLWIREAIVANGIYPQPIGNRGVNRVDVHDIADAAVSALTEPGHNGRIYNICGPENLTGNEVAKVYSRYLGREVRYAGDDLNKWAEEASKMLPDWMVHDFRIMYEFFQRHGFVVPNDDPRIVHHDPRPFDEFVSAITQVWSKEGSRV